MNGTWRSVVTATLALYVAAVSAATLAALPGLRHLAAGGATTVAAGPLDLLRIEKQAAASGGFTLAFSGQRGLLYLGVVCLIVAAVVGFLYRHGRGRLSGKSGRIV